MKEDIETFFNWVEQALSVSEQLVKDDEMGFGREIGLTICFIVLEVMVISLYRKLDLSKYKDKLSRSDFVNLMRDLGVKDKDITRFIKRFDRTCKPGYFCDKKDRIYRIKLILRDGTEKEYEGEITGYELFNKVRNQLVHTGRNIGADYPDSRGCNSAHNILFPHIDTITSDGKTYEHAWLSPETTLKLVRELAHEYKIYCIENNHDPRENINPEEIRVVGVRRNNP